MAEVPAAPPGGGMPVDPTWYKDAILYELHVRSFFDSRGEGTGDFVGLTSRLDYLRDLGVTALWLLPFYPSPLRDDGYDISDYTGVHPSYGTLAEFRAFLRAAHARDLRVVTELVLNHTSDQHPWFQRARRAPPGSSEREFYLWSDTPDRYGLARIIFPDFERSNWTWDPFAKAYYYHRFFSHQPDLNYDHPPVRRAIYRAIDFWLEMGVDGLRLDAVPYLFKREGTNCENLPETHAFLKGLRAHVDGRFPGRMLLAEANQWPEDAAVYFGAGRGDECHAAFHFPLMPRMFMAVRMGNRFPILDMLAQTPKIPADSQWLLFLRNHDELTLEMVSEEERDYMYRVYARDSRMRLNLGIRRRLATLLRNDRRVIELMNALLFSLPGTPVLYYGDELGMGDNIYLGDRNGVRTPMQWNPDRNAGFSRANPQRLYLPVVIDPEYHYEAVNVETQQANPQSLLWHMRRLTALRRQTRSLGRGDVDFLHPENARILAFVRSYEGERVLVVANLSHLAQAVSLDLHAYSGSRPVEMFGRSEFPRITEAPYPLSLGPYGYFWFRLEVPTVDGRANAPAPVLPLAIADRAEWSTLEDPGVRDALEAHLRTYLPTQRWFRGKGRFLESVRWLGTVPLADEPRAPRLVFVRVRYPDADSEVYLLPLGFDRASTATTPSPTEAPHILATFPAPPGEPEPVLRDVGQGTDFARRMLRLIERGRRRRFEESELSARRTASFAAAGALPEADLPVTPVSAEQSNSSTKIGDRFILKLFRQLEAGVSPETELGQFLLRHPPAPVAPIAGTLELRDPRREVYTLATLHRFVPNEGDGWGLTIDHLRRFYDSARARFPDDAAVPAAPPFLGIEPAPAPAIATELTGGYLDLANRLGRRTAEFHRALASDANDPAFAPEPFDSRYVRSILQSMHVQRQEVFGLLRSAAPTLPEPARRLATAVLAQEDEVDRRIRLLPQRPLTGARIRVHGDYHLGQVLWTGHDFVIIDLEGEPLRAISERRLKRSVMRDLAGMLRSFDYAARFTARNLPVVNGSAAGESPPLQRLADLWVAWTWAAFLDGYRAGAAGSVFLPADLEEQVRLLAAYVLNKAIYEIDYELRNRPAWVATPLLGLQSLLANVR